MPRCGRRCPWPLGRWSPTALTGSPRTSVKVSIGAGHKENLAKRNRSAVGRFWPSERQPLTFPQVIPSPHLLGANSSPWGSRPWRTAAPQPQLKWRLMEWILQTWGFPLPRRMQRPQVSGFAHPRPPKSRARVFVTRDACDAERMRMKETFYSSLVFCPSMMSSR